MAVIDLTDLQCKFVEEYLVDLNATQAAIRAGYSENSARQQGSENLSKPDIQEAITKAMQARSKRTQVTADRIVSELAKIAFSQMKSFATWGEEWISFKPSDEIDSEDSACISEITQVSSEKSKTIKLKLHNKVQALELLGRHVGMFKENSDDDKTPQLPIPMAYSLDDEVKTK